MAESDAIIFDMGLYKAHLPTRLRYAEIHFWFDLRDGQTRCGLTSYAARLLADVFRLEWSVQPGAALAAYEPLGEIESTKASSELYAPMAGALNAINSAPVDDPSRIGLDPYGAWLLEFKGQPAQSMDAREYHRFLSEGWEETQKLLKGQM